MAVCLFVVGEECCNSKDSTTERIWPFKKSINWHILISVNCYTAFHRMISLLHYHVAYKVWGAQEIHHLHNNPLRPLRLDQFQCYWKVIFTSMTIGIYVKPTFWQTSQSTVIWYILQGSRSLTTAGIVLKKVYLATRSCNRLPTPHWIVFGVTSISIFTYVTNCMYRYFSFFTSSQYFILVVLYLESALVILKRTPLRIAPRRNPRLRVSKIHTYIHMPFGYLHVMSCKLNNQILPRHHSPPLTNIC